MIDATTLISSAGQFRLHPLGFFYFEERFAKGGLRSRFHIWLENASGKPPSNICHQHSYDIRSKILIGGMRSKLFDFKVDPFGAIREFRVDYGDDSSRLTETERRGELHEVCSFESLGGSSYFLRAGSIHCVDVFDRPCATLLDTVDRGIPIYSYGAEANEPPFERRLATTEEVNEISAVLDKLGA